MNWSSCIVYLHFCSSSERSFVCAFLNPTFFSLSIFCHFWFPNGEPAELINQVALLHNLGLVQSTTNVLSRRTHSLYMSYINNRWNPKEFKQMNKGIDSMCTCKECDYATSPSYVSVFPSNSVGTLFLLSFLSLSISVLPCQSDFNYFHFRYLKKNQIFITFYVAYFLKSCRIQLSVSLPLVSVCCDK